MKTNQLTALVTGASRGIGRGIALALVREKFNVVINYASNLRAAEDVQQQVQSAGAKAHIVQADISSSADRQRLLEEATGAFGRIDLLVNNAGIAPSVRADILDAGEESFDRMIATNLKGPYFLSQIVAKHMIEAVKHGATRPPQIVNITSISAYTASTNRGDYCIAKAGLAMMTRLFAARLAKHGINVYEIRPGIIETDMTSAVKEKYDKLILRDGLTPIARWGRPEDVGRAVVAIAKDLFPFSTGEVINVDGGFHLRLLIGDNVLLGILSDTHDRVDTMNAAMATLQSNGAEFFIHCGDVGGQAILDMLAGLPSAIVWGNNDYDRAELTAYAEKLGIGVYPQLASLELGGKKIAVTHGDDFRLMHRLESGGQYDYLFHGHTHVPRDQRIGCLRIINPGALHRAARKSVALLDLSNDALRYFHI